MLKSPHKKNSLEKLFIIKFVKLVILEVGELYIYHLLNKIYYH